MSELELQQLNKKVLGLQMQNRLLEERLDEMLQSLSESITNQRRLEGSVRELTQRISGPAVPSDGDGLGVFSELTPRQHVILHCFIAGMSYEQMADRLGVSVNTVKTQAKAVRLKWGVDNRSDLIFRARRALAAASDAVYEELSGLPKNWGDKWAHLTREEDPYREVYRASRGRPEDESAE